jgi:hypothetical protein
MRARGARAAAAIAFAWALALACACAGPSRAYKLDVQSKIAVRDWAGAAEAIEGRKASEYGEKNAVLYYLDKAVILHEAGSYAESDELLDRAEQRLDELYTRSISKAAGTFLLNDNTEEYRGEPHERALLHVLRALNYVYMGKQDEATVEARKVSAFLAELGDALGTRPVYRDDAFAQYLSGLLFEDSGRLDDARISFQNARDGYAWYASSYRMPAPQLEPAGGDPGDGELVLFHYNGPAPRRESTTFQVAWNDALAAIQMTREGEGDGRVRNALLAGVAANAVTVAFPVQVDDPFRIQRSEVIVAGRRAPTLLVEDISAISRKALDDKITAIRLRAIARAAVKLILAQLTEAEAKKRLGAGAGALAGLIARATAAATEVADTRCWATIPAQIRMARLRLPPGSHQVTMEYHDASGGVVRTESLSVDIKSGKRSWVHVRTAS